MISTILLMLSLHTQLFALALVYACGPAQLARHNGDGQSSKNLSQWKLMAPKYVAFLGV